MMRLVPNEKVLPSFLELALRGADTRRQIEAVASGTSGSMVKIGSATVMRLKLAVPDTHEQKRIVAAAAALDDRVRTETEAMNKLLLLKRGLIDDLLTGKVRVGAAEEGTA
jgi:type I restriction enzyme S subunit